MLLHGGGIYANLIPGSDGLGNVGIRDVTIEAHFLQAGGKDAPVFLKGLSFGDAGGAKAITRGKLVYIETIAGLQLAQQLRLQSQTHSSFRPHHSLPPPPAR